MTNNNFKVSIFITCLIDNFYPDVGESMVKVLKRVGVGDISFLEDQTCCGQPAFNSGYQDDARILAKRFLKIFQDQDVVVSPSGSCASMVRVFYKDLFKEEPELLKIANEVSDKTYEFSEFLVNVLKIEDVGASYNGKVTYHDSCHLLRELRVKDEPRKLIGAVKGIEFVEMDLHDACCGFGGTFSVKFPDVSTSMLEEKINCILESGADTVVSTDMGCLMQIGGYISRNNIPLKVMHIAELLASD